ncbi:MAG: nucleoside monophosphate kinase [Anaerolineae bacterium]|nr:nucleoside monophosphate kinase [Anaerolineae bacterium]
MMGPPGVGKGTQADLLGDYFQPCHLSTGDVFRAATYQSGPEHLSASMTAALDYMKRGMLAPDETVIDMIRERARCLACQHGFLLDGFPRSVAQAKALDAMLEGLCLRLDAVINYTLPTAQVVERLSGRRTCRGCKATFHVQGKPPKVENVCDHCEGELYQREDDYPEAIHTRLEEYKRSTAPLEAFYAGNGVLVTVSAEGAPEDIFQRTVDAVLSS